MRKSLLILIVWLSTLSGCHKPDNPVISGIVTIESTLYGTGPYYAYGFSFSSSKKISTTSVPAPDITVYAWRNLDGTIKEISFEASNYENSFSLAGEFGTEADAILGFTNLKTVGDERWTASAVPLRKNQIWLFKTNKGNYAKVRIVSTIEEIRQNLPYGECTFEWFYQPDGSVTFSSR